MRVMVAPIECGTNAVVGNSEYQPNAMTSVRPSMTSVMLVVNGKAQKRFSIKTRNKYGAHTSKQGVSSPHCYVDIMKLCCEKRLQSSPQMASAHTTSTSILSDTSNSGTHIFGWLT